MSTRTVEDPSTDVLVRDEIVRNQRMVEHPDLGKIRLRRPTPRVERLIASERQRQYHTDLRNPDILSKAELQVIFERRGMWNDEKELRLQELSRKVGELMGLLNFLGYKDFDDLADRYWQVRAEIAEMFSEEEDEEKRAKVIEALTRYFRLMNDEGEPAQQAYPDRAAIQSNAPSTKVDDLLDEADSLREQLDTLRVLGEVRTDLLKLQREFTTCFVDSLESRANRSEELAQLYYCARLVQDEEDATKDEYITTKFDGFLDLDPEVIGFLQEEMYFFLNGVTEEMREVFARHGFTQRMLTSDNESDDSPEHPTPNSDGEPQESPEPASSE